MVDAKSVQAQLKRIKFNPNTWGRAEIAELPNILLPNEKIYECVNGTYEGGFALLVATNTRVLLVDKKPLNYLTVEDLRFDMINELDYSHRLMGARITITTGNKTLRFRSYNQERLRKLLSHVQHRMSEIKEEQSEHAENQKQHLEEINKQLQAYLLAQYEQQMRLHQQLQQAATGQTDLQPVKPNHQLSDYLFAQSLLAQQKMDYNPKQMPKVPEPEKALQEVKEQEAEAAEFLTTQAATNPQAENLFEELAEEGRKEVFGKTEEPETTGGLAAQQDGGKLDDLKQWASKSLEVNPLKIAYSKLPMMLSRRRLNAKADAAASGSGQWEPAKAIHIQHGNPNPATS